MAQEYHNRITVLGDGPERQSFVTDAIRLSPKWGWDWVGIDINDLAGRGQDAGKSKLDFWSRNFPLGLDELMRLHPDLTLEAVFFDASAPRVQLMTLKNNEILEESAEDVEWEGDGDVEIQVHGEILSCPTEAAGCVPVEGTEGRMVELDMTQTNWRTWPWRTLEQTSLVLVGRFQVVNDGGRAVFLEGCDLYQFGATNWRHVYHEPPTLPEGFQVDPDFQAELDALDEKGDDHV